tara:strand:+ start:553493 stop:554065 length:573 start_codon:yes stop_codon:yes gene_type:complete
MSQNKFLLTSAAIATLFLSAGAQAQESIGADAAKSFINDHVASWLSDTTITDAITAQNTAYAGLDEAAVIALDKKWRADDEALINSTTQNALSTFLKDKQDTSEGLFTEIFIMDDKGMNVGQSTLTSDYWQGDEAKWQKTYAVGADAVHVSEVEFDESSQSYQVQISTTINKDGQAIGAITLGVNAEMIE